MRPPSVVPSQRIGLSRPFRGRLVRLDRGTGQNPAGQVSGILLLVSQRMNRGVHRVVDPYEVPEVGVIDH